jgi:hypothetical protein
MFSKVAMGVATLALAVTMSACTAGQGVAVPDREVAIDIDTALAAQNSAMGGLMMGGVTLDESQFSSLLTELLKANSGENTPIDSITTWFGPDGGTFIQVKVNEGVLPPALGDTLVVAGNIGTDAGKIVVDVTEASAGTYKVEGPVLAPITSQINAALANLNFGVPVQVETDEGTVTISLTQ